MVKWRESKSASMIDCGMVFMWHHGVMTQAYVLTGHLENARSLALDEPLPLTQGKVRVTVQPIREVPSQSDARVLAQIWTANANAGRIPPTREEVDHYLEVERASWD